MIMYQKEEEEASSF
ncbi:BH1490 [Halalkalibacterium halodurans C-125]|uniref:BH1490 protein n=1 Tax=Halalkalibacterium halodurans (strain ATCC BAA-125 / DSM 18197 / FERM 7344 / JCM 9153 / C-125) TaxID=272558 RepID=Q9KCS9_HALH5|nr:BH1490 [Halalkalibacterium halodurans C-125]